MEERGREPIPKHKRKHDADYMERVRGLPCAVYGMGNCMGRIEAHHAGVKPGKGMKADDDTCIPLCRLHHRQFEDHRGAFYGWSRSWRRAWQDVVIAETRERLR